jgi:serine/threonine protein kinase/tetratricopeptide (TPR) repeat protein
MENTQAGAPAPSPKEDDEDRTPALGAAPTEAGALTGKTVSHYRVLDILGGGGMGVVYRAEDIKLGRQVAVKFLPEEMASDAQTLQRFEREAQTASSLNHPNICTIHEFGEHEGQPFLVMESLQGETLRERLAAAAGGKGLPLKELLDIALQVSDGLQAAHERGIIHRDIKPANIFITESGVCKILDFGIAKLLEEAPAEGAPGPSNALGASFSLAKAGEGRMGLHLWPELKPDLEEKEGRGAEAPLFHPLPTPTAPPHSEHTLTRTGSAMGTAGYMSPEQVRGEKLDARTDLFSFGLILYEMATGQRAFSGGMTEIIYNTMLRQPQIAVHDLNPTLPPEVGGIINKALEKDRGRRYQSAAEMRVDLEQLGSGKPAPARQPWIWAVAAGLLAVLAVAGGLYWRSHNRPKLTDKDTIVLSDFDNKTGDAVFDDTLKQGLSVQLEQSPFLELVSERKVNETLKLMGRPAGDRLTPEVTREVCQRVGSKAMLTGSIAGLGSDYVIALKAMNCNTGDVLAHAQEQAAGKEGVLKALDAAAVTLRSKLGESLSTVQKYATPLEEATTPSLEALKAYSLAQKTRFVKGRTAALPLYKRAVELDPSFAMAYRAMAVTYSNLNEVGRAAENASKAYGLREKASEPERFNIAATYYMNATGELEKAAKAYELWQQTYPRSDVPYANLGFIYGSLGNLEKSLEQDREAMRLDPNSVVSYLNLGGDYANLNRLGEAEAVYKQAEERKLEDEGLLVNRYQLAFLKGDKAQMAQLTGAAVGKPGTEDLLLASQADTEAWFGRVKNAHELTRRATDSAQHNDAKETAATYQAAAALREVESGNPKQARAEANAALKLAPNRDVRAMAAVALARAGDTAAAEKLAVELGKSFPLDTLIQRYWLPTIRAAIALEHKDPNRAVELLNTVRPIELAQATNLAVLLSPVYLRGEAYLMLHDGSAAATEFQKFIDHYGLVGNFPWGALARLGLARAYALDAAKDPATRDKARTAYQNFLTLWKDADPDVPVLIQAKAEYAKLQ